MAAEITPNIEKDTHGRHSSKVERLEGHLGAGLADALGTNSTHRRARLDLGPGVLLLTDSQETLQLGHRATVDPL